MVSQNNEVNCLIHLLSCAINQKECEDIGDVDFKELFSLAKKHQVYNIIYPVICDFDSIPQYEKDKWRNYNLTEIKRMITINNERSAIFNALKDNKIRFMPLKGLILKNYYPKESMRQMSDNDILFDEENRDAVAEIMKNFGYKPVATGENSDDYFKAPYCTFEFHRNLFFEEHDFCPRFDNLWVNSFVDSGNPFMYHMGLDDVYVYSVCHMYKHYSTAGCGVRFLADNYLFLKKEQNNLNWDYISGKMQEYGIAEYEKKSRELAFKIFDEEPLNDEEIKLLENYINFGIYGDGNIALRRNIEKLSENGDIQNAKKKYIFRRLFPEKKKMIADYRVLEKKPYLLPFYYIYRLFKGARNGSKTLSEYKAVKDMENK